MRKINNFFKNNKSPFIIRKRKDIGELEEKLRKTEFENSLLEETNKKYYRRLAVEDIEIVLFGPPRIYELVYISEMVFHTFSGPGSRVKTSLFCDVYETKSPTINDVSYLHDLQTAKEITWELYSSDKTSEAISNLAAKISENYPLRDTDIVRASTQHDGLGQAIGKPKEHIINNFKSNMRSLKGSINNYVKLFISQSDEINKNFEKKDAMFEEIYKVFFNEAKHSGFKQFIENTHQIDQGYQIKEFLLLAESKVASISHVETVQGEVVHPNGRIICYGLPAHYKNKNTYEEKMHSKGTFEKMHRYIHSINGGRLMDIECLPHSIKYGAPEDFLNYLKEKNRYKKVDFDLKIIPQNTEVFVKEKLSYLT